MAIRPVGCHSTTTSALQEAFLDQVGLVDVFESATIFSNGCRQGAGPGGTAMVVADQRGQDLAINLVEAELVHLQMVQGMSRRGSVDAAVAFDLGEVADAA